MVVLTIVTQKNGETVYFDEPILQVHYMKLLSCSLYNSWHNLKSVGRLVSKPNELLLAEIPQGHYTLQFLAEELTESLGKNKNKNTN